MKNSKSILAPVLATIFLLALFLRLYKLESQSFWLDEYFNVLTANAQSFKISDFLPPLYIFLLKFWLQFFPVTEFFVRLPGALIGAGSVLLFYLFAKELFDRDVAVLSGLILAISAIHVDYSQEAKYYSTALAMAMLLNYGFVRTL